MSVKRALRRFPAPDQLGAEARAWDVVRTAFQEREPAPRRRPYRRQSVGVAIGLVLAVSVVLSPAGATVGRLISHAFGERHASPALIALPAPGRLLVSSPSGTWTVSGGGTKRWIGSWTGASWSPHGRYLAVVRRGQLVAVTPSGLPQWGLARPAVRDPSWYPSSGYRVAYLSGRELRVVAGDGRGDHLVATRVARVAPAWRPGHPYQLAYVAGGGVWVRSGDTGALLWAVSPGAPVRQLAWSADGRRLLAVSSHRVFIYAGSGRLLSMLTPPGGGSIQSAALSPDGRTVALVSAGATDGLVVFSLAGGRPNDRRLLSGFGLGQVAFSPNGRWLLVTWPAADQWVFVRVAGTPRIAAASRIAQHFSGGRAPRFPELDGWCCSATGGSG